MLIGQLEKENLVFEQDGAGSILSNWVMKRIGYLGAKTAHILILQQTLLPWEKLSGL